MNKHVSHSRAAWSSCQPEESAAVLTHSKITDRSVLTPPTAVYLISLVLVSFPDPQYESGYKTSLVFVHSWLSPGNKAHNHINSGILLLTCAEEGPHAQTREFELDISSSGILTRSQKSQSSGGFILRVIHIIA